MKQVEKLLGKQVKEVHVDMDTDFTITKAKRRSI